MEKKAERPNTTKMDRRNLKKTTKREKNTELRLDGMKMDKSSLK